MASRVSLILYPEGATLETPNKVRSQKFAEKNGLSPAQRTLLPREAGFCQVIKNAAIDSIYDVTIGIPEFGDGKGGEKPLKYGLPQALMGVYPKEICMHIERYGISEDSGSSSTDSNNNSHSIIVSEDTSLVQKIQKPGLKNLTPDDLTTTGSTSLWLRNLYREKDERLKVFYETEQEPKLRKFKGEVTEIKYHVCKAAQLWTSLFWWLAVFSGMISATILVPYFGYVWAAHVICSATLSLLQRFRILPAGIERLIIMFACISVRFCQTEDDDEDSEDESE